MRRGRRSVDVRGADGHELSQAERLASVLVQHRRDRSRLVRQGLFSAALAVVWLIAGISRLASGGRVVAGFLILGALFFAARCAAHVVTIRSLPPGDEDSKES